MDKSQRLCGLYLAATASFLVIDTMVSMYFNAAAAVAPGPSAVEAFQLAPRDVRIAGVVLASTLRARSPHPGFDDFLVYADRYSFLNTTLPRQACTDPAKKGECHKRDFLTMLGVLRAIEDVDAFYLIEDDTFYCEHSFEVLREVLQQALEARAAGRADVRIVLTGIGASGLLVLRDAIPWFAENFAASKVPGPDVFLSFSPALLKHVYRLKINLNVHVGGFSILGWNAKDRPTPSCFEYSCLGGVNGYDAFDFNFGCGLRDLYSPVSKCNVNSSVLTSRPDNVRLLGYPGYTCRKRQDVWDHYRDTVLRME